MRTFVMAAASAWSKVPEHDRRLLRPLFWRLPGLQSLRKRVRSVLSTEVPENASQRQARLAVSDALCGELTRAGLISRVLRLGLHEPRTLVLAASPRGVVRFARRFITPDASGWRSAPLPPSRLEIEVHQVLERFRRPIEAGDVGNLDAIELPHFVQPEVSFVIPVWNHWQFTSRCLAAIAANVNGVSYEVIVVDNGSFDQTKQLLDGIRNVRVVRNEKNLGFLLASNSGASAARGRYLLFLNNDTHILSGTVQALISTIRSDPTVGAVGGRLITLDGRLQEAGSIVWNSGACLGYGRGDHPFDPQYSYVRDVDYCSAAMLLTPRELFMRLGGFDERYAPAYYEDSDYCMSLWANGLRVVYQPAATIIHHEFGSSPRAQTALDAQARNQGIFVEKWRATLVNHAPASIDQVLAARDASRRPRLLVVDDCVPDPRLGTGYPRAYRLVTSLQELGWSVTFFPFLYPERNEPSTSELQALGVEVITRDDGRRLNLKQFLERRRDLYEVVLISRPHNMKEALPLVREAAPHARLVYDAEAIFAERELQLRRLHGITTSDTAARATISREGSLVAKADAVTAVSEHEARTLASFGARRTYVVGHQLNARPTSTRFQDRAHLLFVGGILDSPSPNEDAVLYLVREILPAIRRQLECKLFVVGTNRSSRVAALESHDIRIVGPVDDLEPWYSRSRVFLVPTRYAAGLPMKLHEASAFGLPSVVTPLIAKQVAWSDGHEVLVGSSSEEFAHRVVELYSDEMLWQRVRSAALSAVRRDCSRESFLTGLRGATGLTSEPWTVVASDRRPSMASASPPF
jgi:GT2 family glycosyltransferase/glycosyltransferase involved in cell wall biosynthesis